MADDDAYRVNLEALDDLISTMAQFSRHTEEQVAEVDRVTAAMPWEGATEVAHKTWQAQWRSGIDDLHQSMTKLREGARIAHTNYTGALRANTAMWNQ